MPDIRAEIAINIAGEGTSLIAGAARFYAGVHACAATLQQLRVPGGGSDP